MSTVLMHGNYQGLLGLLVSLLNIQFKNASLRNLILQKERGGQYVNT